VVYPRKNLGGEKMKDTDEIRQELLLKEIRTAYWELNHRIPSMTDLDKLEREGVI
jgi:hypothetical protein